MNAETKIEIFCGTGGVGKTTLAAARAVFWGQLGKKVLLITIDPAHRLKQLFGLANSERGAICPIKLDPEGEIAVQLMCPEATWKKIFPSTTDHQQHFQQNYILRILSRPDAGLLEILAMVEIKLQVQSQEWDLIIVDTPPGKSLLDFLDASNKISKFFQQTFIDFFQILNRKKQPRISNFASNFFQAGMEKLLKYLGQVTGDHFITNLVEAIYLVYTKKELFITTLDFQEHMKKSIATKWFLVAATGQYKIAELQSLDKKLTTQMHGTLTLIVNMCNETALLNWNIESNGNLKGLRNSLLQQEQTLKRQLTALFQYPMIEFSHCPSNDLGHQLSQLAGQWDKLI